VYLGHENGRWCEDVDAEIGMVVLLEGEGSVTLGERRLVRSRYCRSDVDVLATVRS